MLEHRQIAICVAALLTLTACAGAPSPTATAPPTATHTPAATATPSAAPTLTAVPTAAPTATLPPPEMAPTAEVTGPAQALVAAAREDLAARLGVDPARIAVISVEAQNWSDSSLGCPQPGFMYAQVITPGYRILLAEGQRRFAYHTDSAHVVFCEQDKP